jgi:hypothetical protein
MKYLLIFLSYFDFSSKCDDVVEYTTDVHNDDRTIPDEQIEAIKYWTGRHFYKFSDFQTYPDNWGCHNKEIISFIFKERYCEISEMFNDNSNYMSIRIYPTSLRCVK